MEEQNNVPSEVQLIKYDKYYSAKKLLEKLKDFALQMGQKAVYAALILYYVLASDKVPMKEKGLIIGALGYLILPVDLVPDAIPLLGFSDDFAALMFAVQSVSNYIDEDIKKQAKAKLKEWFGSVDEEEIREVI